MILKNLRLKFGRNTDMPPSVIFKLDMFSYRKISKLQCLLHHLLACKEFRRPGSADIVHVV
jgi:hypothetical protein